MLNFLFANQLQFQPTNKAKLLFLSSSFVTLFSSSYGLTIFKYRHIAKPYPLHGIKESINLKFITNHWLHCATKTPRSKSQ
jgi:hypothetical protein